MKKAVCFVLMAMLLMLPLCACSSSASRSSSNEQTQVVDLNNLTDRERTEFSPYKMCSDSAIKDKIVKACKDSSVLADSANKQIAFALKFNGNTAEDNVNSFKKAISELSSSKVICNSKYSKFRFYLIEGGDIRLQTAPLSISNGKIEPFGLLFYYSKSDLDKKYSSTSFK